MFEENASQKIRLENIDETKNCFLEEIKQIELLRRKGMKVCTTLYYIEHFLILGSTITGCISIPAFTSLISIPINFRKSFRN